MKLPRFKKNRLGRIVRIRCDECGQSKGLSHFRRITPRRRSRLCNRCVDNPAKNDGREAAVRRSWA